MDNAELLKETRGGWRMTTDGTLYIAMENMPKDNGSPLLANLSTAIREELAENPSVKDSTVVSEQRRNIEPKMLDGDPPLNQRNFAVLHLSHEQSAAFAQAHPELVYGINTNVIGHPITTREQAYKQPSTGHEQRQYQQQAPTPDRQGQQVPLTPQEQVDAAYRKAFAARLHTTNDPVRAHDHAVSSATRLAEEKGFSDPWDRLNSPTALRLAKEAGATPEQQASLRTTLAERQQRQQQVPTSNTSSPSEPQQPETPTRQQAIDAIAYTYASSIREGMSPDQAKAQILGEYNSRQYFGEDTKQDFSTLSGNQVKAVLNQLSDPSDLEDICRRAQSNESRYITGALDVKIIHAVEQIEHQEKIRGTLSTQPEITGHANDQTGRQATGQESTLPPPIQRPQFQSQSVGHDQSVIPSPGGRSQSSERNTQLR